MALTEEDKHKFVPGRFGIMTHEEASECGKKGGKRSGEVRRQRKTYRETLLLLLGMPVKRGKVATLEDIKAFADLKGKNVDMQTAGLIAIVGKQAKGDLQAAQFIRDTIGETPVGLIDDGTSEQIANATQFILKVRTNAVTPAEQEDTTDDEPTESESTDDK